MYRLKSSLRKLIYYLLTQIYGKENDIVFLLEKNDGQHNLYYNRNYFTNSKKGEFTKITPKYHIISSDIGDYTYISQNSIIKYTTIGKFCSIGPNLMCGWGIHPTNGLSTAPMFYSTNKQNDISLSNNDKVIENKHIHIGNDVFIGMNVIILDGIKIGDGAVIGAGAVITKDIPPYAIAVGNPAKIIKYRFDEETIKKLLEIKWWEWESEKLKDVEKYFFSIPDFLKKHF